VLHNKPTTITVSSVFGLKLAHTADCITSPGSWLHWCTPNQTWSQLLFYSCV